MNAQQIARYVIAFSWIYHGLFPKLMHIAPLERLMTASLGLSTEMSDWVTRFAGISEILFGIVFFVFYTNKTLNILNIIGMLALLLFVATLQPQLLIEAFNPVTTNLPLIAFSVILLRANVNQKTETHQ